MDALLIVGLGLALKHFIADGPLQRPYQYLNKGNLSHPGGWLHAVIHGWGTLIVLWAAGLADQFGYLAVIDAMVHYTIDWTKVNATKRFKWSGMMKGEWWPDGRYNPPHLAIYSDYYFWALVADQALHFATYAVILWAIAP